MSKNVNLLKYNEFYNIFACLYILMYSALAFQNITNIAYIPVQEILDISELKTVIFNQGGRGTLGASRWFKIILKR